MLAGTNRSYASWNKQEELLLKCLCHVLAESSGQSHSSQLSSQQTPFADRPEPMTKQQREQGLRQLSFPAQTAALHMGLHQSESSQPQSTWQDPPVLTPREVAVKQLISHKLQAGARQHGPVSIHFAQRQSPVTLQSPKPGSPAAHLAAASSATHRSSLPEVQQPTGHVGCRSRRDLHLLLQQVASDVTDGLTVIYQTADEGFSDLNHKGDDM